MNTDITTDSMRIEPNDDRRIHATHIIRDAAPGLPGAVFAYLDGRGGSCAFVLSLGYDADDRSTETLHHNRFYGAARQAAIAELDLCVDWGRHPRARPESLRKRIGATLEALLEGRLQDAIRAGERAS